METRQLEYFVAVAEELNFTRASQQLFAVQSTVSAGIASLERELGTSLFDRSTKRVALTAAGDALLPEARAAIESIDRVRSAVALTRDGIRGRVRVGIFTNFAFINLARLFADFRRAYPLVDLQLVASASGSTGLADDVTRGRVDLAFMGLPRADLTGFLVLPLARSRFDAILPADHRLAARESVTLAELADEQWVDSPAGFGNRIGIERALAAEGLARTVSTQVSDLGEVPLFVAAGLGVAALPRITYLATDGIVAVPIERPMVPWELNAISRADPSPASTALLDLLSERFAEAG
ncbi:MAG: LysR family transcriptional regulator [Microbacteriaceae bacterium]|jgi:DNA-binding transcriptional LysR family regulator|nr:LysR family transcriptional regulator [Microbacteriaceae bacterium]